MITLFARHGVEDYDKWKSGYDSADAVGLRKENGVIEETVYRVVEENAVIATHNFKDQTTANAFVQVFGSAETGKMLREMGVRQPVTVWLGEEV
jgi:xylose isomerase